MNEKLKRWIGRCFLIAFWVSIIVWFVGCGAGKTELHDKYMEGKREGVQQGQAMALGQPIPQSDKDKAEEAAEALKPKRYHMTLELEATAGKSPNIETKEVTDGQQLVISGVKVRLIRAQIESAPPALPAEKPLEGPKP